jgi:pimeloyl-ACP methyl ester carboxylesterase
MSSREAGRHHTMTPLETGYADVRGLRMYHELHGPADAPPLVLLHGAYMSTGTFGPLLPGLSAHRRVIVPDLQGHGRTTDADRPITYEGMADDVAALLAQLGIGRADVVGYSMGAGVALQLAVRHPRLVRALVPISCSYRHDGMQPALLEFVPSITPELFAGSPFEQTYTEIAPDPSRFPVLVEKLRTLDMTPFAWPEIAEIPASVLVVVGDGDCVTPEHAVEMLRLLGGGGMGDMAPPARNRLAILPGTNHFMPPGRGMLDRYAWLLPMITDFLDGADGPAGEPEPRAASAAQ